MRRIGTPAALTFAAMLLTACSSSGSSNNHTQPGLPGPSSGVGQHSTPGVPPGAQVLGTSTINQPFTLNRTQGSVPGEAFQVTVTSVTCGQPLDQAAINHEAISIGDTPSPAPTPETGHQFCVVTMQGTNVGNSKANWDAEGDVTLNVGATAYSETQTDSDYATDYEQYASSQGHVGPPFGINPNSSGPVYGVYELPAGQTPTSMWFSSASAITNMDGVQPGYLVTLGR